MIRTLFFLLFAFPAFICGNAQQIGAALEVYAEKYQPDRVYLHLDKAAYFPGETIWFKAYLMEGMFPAHNSKTLYIDLISNNGQVLAHNVGPIVDGTSNGQFDIPETYQDDIIHVRAYTKWMLNEDTAFLYQRSIPVLNYSKETTKKIISADPLASIQFFPEGGEAVASVPNRIAVKANDQWGRPVKFHGALIDNKGKVVDSAHSSHNGMGSFVFIPEINQAYSFRWKDEKGKVHTDPLPVIRQEGLTMQVSISGKRRIITINANNKNAGNLSGMHLVGTMNHTMVFNTEINMEPGKNVRRVIPTENLPTGILTITLFDATWKPVSERICFIDNGGYSVQPSFEVKYWGLGKRKRNEIEIVLPDSIEWANLSVSVTDAAIVKDTTHNIISHLLLQSEVRGRVHDPDYYFTERSFQKDEHLDLVMLTHGWRKFRWKEILQHKPPDVLFPRDTAYMSLSGQIFGVTKNQLSGNDNIVFIVKQKDSSIKMMILPILKDGTFSDPDIIIFDTVQVYYSLKSKLFSNAEARFMTERLPAPNYTAFSKNFQWIKEKPDTSGFHHFWKIASEAKEISDQRKFNVLETVKITTKQKTPLEILEEKYPSGMFQGGNSISFDLVNNMAAMGSLSVLNYLQGRVAGLQIENSGSQPVLSWRGQTPQIFVDEIPVTAEMTNMIPISDIAYVKVFRPPFMGAYNSAGGAIAIYTRKGNDRAQSAGGGLNSSSVTGYSAIREFYSPNYDTFDPRNENKDLRTTIYWDPQVTLARGKNKVLLRFYNNDVAESFRVIIEGITAGGLLIHKEEIME